MPDPKRRLGGRGVWVEANRDCLKRACQSGFTRLAKRPLRPRYDELAGLLILGLEARLSDVLGGGYRAGLVHYGADETTKRVKAGSVRLIALATDASPRHRGGVTGEDAPPHVLVLDKARLGAVFGRQDVAVATISDDALAASVHEVTKRINAINPNVAELPQNKMTNALDGEEHADAHKAPTASAGDETEA